MTKTLLKEHKDGIYELRRASAEDEIPLILDSPHSGRTYPSDFQTLIPYEDLICGEDRYVNELFPAPQKMGATWLCALFPRSYIDVNRHYSDIHPRMIHGKWQGSFPLLPSKKSSAGIGLIREHFHDGRAFYAAPLHTTDIVRRIQNYYAPYHAALCGEINRLHDTYGVVYHLNCHSMPSESAPRLSPSQRGRADIVLGTLDGTSASDAFTNLVQEAFETHDFSTLLNNPYKGVEIVERYGNPAQNRHSIQIEINRALYLDNDERYKNPDFVEIAARLTDVIATISRQIKRTIKERRS